MSRLVAPLLMVLKAAEPRLKRIPRLCNLSSRAIFHAPEQPPQMAHTRGTLTHESLLHLRAARGHLVVQLVQFLSLGLHLAVDTIGELFLLLLQLRPLLREVAEARDCGRHLLLRRAQVSTNLCWV